MTIGIQLADVMAGVLKRYYQEGLHLTQATNNESLYLQKLREYHRIISRRVSSGNMLYEAPEDFLSRFYTQSTQTVI